MNRRLLLGLLTVSLLALAWLWSGTHRPEPPRVAPAERLRGMTISCQTSGWEWGDPATARAMDDLKTLGVNAVSFHPYARIMADGYLRWQEARDADEVLKPLAWAAERHMAAMLVPHIAYWGSPFAWRGDIDFKSPEEWEHFFTDYERWIISRARLAEEGRAPLFCVGLEYTHAQKFEARWRRIIAAVRQVYHGRVTYGANWNELDAVPFWDALDCVGVLAYFPLCDSENPDAAHLDAGWKRWMKALSATAARTQKPILFVELGYDARTDAARRPWADDGLAGESARALQVRCLTSALQACEGAPWLAGVFLWKWFPDLHGCHHESFDLRAPETRAAIQAAWQPAR